MLFCAPARAHALGWLCLLLLLGGAPDAPRADAAEGATVQGRRKRTRPARVKRERGRRRHHRAEDPPPAARGGGTGSNAPVAPTAPGHPDAPVRNLQTYKPPPGPLPKLDLAPVGPVRSEDEVPPMLVKKADEAPAAVGSPLWRRWWLWAIVGGVVATGVGVGVGVGVSRSAPQIPAGIEIRDAF